MRATLTDSPAYELTADLEPNEYGFNLKFESYVATARNPEVQRKFQAQLSKRELLRLRWLIDDVLTACGETQLDRPAERVFKEFPPGQGPHIGALNAYHAAVAERRRLEALKNLATSQSTLSLRDIGYVADVLHTSLRGYQGPSASLARHVAYVLVTALRNSEEIDAALPDSLLDGTQVLGLNPKSQALANSPTPETNQTQNDSGAVDQE